MVTYKNWKVQDYIVKAKEEFKHFFGAHHRGGGGGG
jgi:hypothetical protein